MLGVLAVITLSLILAGAMLAGIVRVWGKRDGFGFGMIPRVGLAYCALILLALGMLVGMITVLLAIGANR